MKSLQVLFGGTFDPRIMDIFKPVETLANLIGFIAAIIMPTTPPHAPAGSSQRAA